MQLQDLVLAYQSRLSPTDVKTICWLLASNAHAPKTLIKTLCKRTVRISQPLLLTSHTLSCDDFIELIDLKGLDHAKVIARRTDNTPKLRDYLRALNDDRIDRALDLRQKPAAAVTNDEASPSVLQLHRIDRTRDNEFLHLAREDDLNFIHTALADSLSLDLVSVENLCGDITSRNLPIALHYLRLSVQIAWSLFERLAKDDTLNEEIKTAFFTAYESLDFQTSWAIVQSWQMDDLRAREIYKEAANQPDMNYSQKLTG